jgi:geranylgeranyl diphosphate synthase, type I
MTDLIHSMLTSIEAALHVEVARLQAPDTLPLHEMLNYHMGWTGEGAGQDAGGKRIRPLLLLLVNASCGANWLHALPAAAAVELAHNFSLIHDDIQDNSPTRRGRPTLWKKWSARQAINAGDALFVISNLAMLDLSRSHPTEAVIKSVRLFNDTCLELTRGQFLDMTYEKRNDLTVQDYWGMIGGKTAALLSASTQIGAILSGADDAVIEQYRDFGRDLGLAFQVRDDILGIWGDEALTGKSAASDLVEGKNSLPILYGISRGKKFAQRWAASAIAPADVQVVAETLKDEGAYDFSRREAERLTAQALDALQRADGKGEAARALLQMADKLLSRES